MLINRYKTAVISDAPDGLFENRSFSFDLFHPSEISIISSIPFDIIVIDARNGRTPPHGDSIALHLSGANIMFAADTYDGKNKTVLSGGIPAAFGICPLSEQEIISCAAPVADMKERMSVLSSYQEFVETINAVMIKADSKAQITFVNDAAEKLFARPRNQITGNQLLSFTHPDDLERTQKMLNLLTRNNVTSHNFENRQVAADGKTKAVIWSISIHYGNQGEILYINCVLKDVTELRSAQLDTLNATKQAKKYFEAAANIIIVLNDTGQISIANKKAKELLNQGKEISCMSFVEKFVPPEDRQKAAELIAESQAETSGFFQVVSGFGNMRDVLWHTSVLHEPDGKISRILSGEDMTEILRTEKLLRDRELALRKTFDASKDIIIILDKTGSTIDFNSQLTKILNTTRRQTLSKTLWNLLPEQTVAQLRHEFTSSLDDSITRTFELPAFSGWYEIRISPILEDDGQIENVVLFMRDITEKKQTELFAAMNEKRHRSLAILGQMYEAEFEEILEYALDSAIEQTDSRSGTISIMDSHSGGLRLVASINGTDRTVYSVREGVYIKAEDMPGLDTVLKTNEPFIGTGKSRYMIIPMLAQGGVSLILYISGKESPYTLSESISLMHFMEGVWRLKERKEAEEQINLLNAELEAVVEQRTCELKESENRFRTAFETSANGMAIISPEGGIIQANRAFARILGYDVADLSGKSVYDFTHREYTELTKNLIKSLVTGERNSYSAVKKYMHKDGGVVTLSVSAALAKNEDQSPMYIVAQMVDITESERTRTERDRIFEHSYDIICIITFEGELRYVNKAFETMLGLSSDMILGKDFTSLFSMRDLLKAGSFINKLVQGEDIRDYESRHKTAAGENVWLSWYASADMEHRLIYAIARNINDRKKYEEDLKKAKEEAEKGDRAKSEFIANISHEIRTPLNAVIGFSELLSARVKDSKSKSYISSLKSSANSLLKLINDILDISKLLSGTARTETAPADLRHLINEILNIFQIKARTKGIKIYSEFKSCVPDALVVDASRMRQVLLNLVGNAIKFTEQGHVRIFTSTKQQPNGKLLLTIAVEDTGTGIPQQDFESIFEPFRQRNEQDHTRFGGTGLGLSISKKLVEMMGGSIELKSTVGRGSTFSVVIPDVNAGSIAKSHKDLACSVKFHPQRVLVIDPEETERNIIREVFENCGLFVLEAQNGSAAALIAEEIEPALIVMDTNLPDMDGQTAAARIKHSAINTSTPVIAIMPQGSDTIKGHLFSDVLFKPIDFESLIAVAAKYIPVESISEPISAKNTVTDRLILSRVIHDGSEEAEELEKLIKNNLFAVNIEQVQKIYDIISDMAVKKNSSELINLAEKMRTGIDNMEIAGLKNLLKGITDSSD